MRGLLSGLIHLLATSIGRKILVAITGLALLGFLVGHLLGNLLIFQGRDALNAYAAWLKCSPLLWPARVGLLTLFVGHVYLAIRLARENRAARPNRYRRAIATTGTGGTTSQFVLLTGLTVLAFVVFHLLHFTMGVVDSEGHRLVDPQGRHDVFGMVLHSFGIPWILIAYVVAMALLGMHLWHGSASAIRTLGVSHPSWRPLVVFAARALVIALIAGNIAIPVLVHFGIGTTTEMKG